MADVYCTLQFDTCGCTESDFPNKAACIAWAEGGWADEIDEGLQRGGVWNAACATQLLGWYDCSTRKQFEAKACVACSLLVGATAEGGACNADADCADGLKCRDFACAPGCPGTLGQACDNVPCGIHLACDDATATCAPGPGLGDLCGFNDCLAGFYCDAGTCAQAKPLGAPCMNYPECESRVCDGGACAAEKPLICDD
jgi:hypothetical protein